MEKDGNDWTGNNGSHLDFGARIYDSRLGRFLSRDAFAHKFQQSSYLFAGNSPIMAIDVNGDSLYVVTSAGKVFNIYSKDGNETSTLIGRDILLKTVDGAELLEKYENNSKHDIYITVSKNIEGLRAGAQTIGNAGMLVGKDGKISMVNYISKTSGLVDFLNFEGVEVKNEGNKTSLVVFNSDYLDNEGNVFKGKGYDLYDFAESLFHEFKAHIDLIGADDEHEAYGSTYTGVDGASTPNSPASKIKNEIKIIRSADENMTPIVSKQDNTKLNK